MIDITEFRFLEADDVRSGRKDSIAHKDTLVVISQTTNIPREKSKRDSTWIHRIWQYTRNQHTRVLTSQLLRGTRLPNLKVTERNTEEQKK